MNVWQVLSTELLMGRWRSCDLMSWLNWAFGNTRSIGLQAVTSNRGYIYMLMLMSEFAYYETILIPGITITIKYHGFEKDNDPLPKHVCVHEQGPIILTRIDFNFGMGKLWPSS